MLSLVKQGYFDQNIKPKLGPAKASEAITHNLCDLKGVNGGEIPITRYFEMTVTFLVLKVPKIWFIIIKDPNELIEAEKKTKLPGIIGWNLVKLSYQEFIKIYAAEIFSNFHCLEDIDHLLFL